MQPTELYVRYKKLGAPPKPKEYDYTPTNFTFFQ